MKREIHRLILVFPHKISVEVAQKISIEAQIFAQAEVSEGGFVQEETIFSDDSMVFYYGHDKSRKEKCKNCGSEEFSIVRDMTSRRVCRCGYEWEYTK